MPHAHLVLPAIVIGGLIFGWIMARWLERRYDRRNKASSVELLDELEMAYSSRHSVEVFVSMDELPRLFACIAEQIDSGFGEKHARQMLQRIASQGPRNALYPIRVNGVRSELELQWNRDSAGRVRLLTLAVPKVIRALKRQIKRLPRPADAEPSAT
jgi:hypothetical protein